MIGGRAAGVLLHPTSLPGRGIGDLGDQAYRWVDWLADSGQSIWQVLPLVPISAGGSPYNAPSAFGGNALLISPDRLTRDGLLPADELESSLPADGPIDFPAVIAWKEALHASAHRRFAGGAAHDLSDEYEAFRARSAYWLKDYALFRALHDHHDGAAWTEWDVPIRDRHPQAIDDWSGRLAERIEHNTFLQFIFDRQWRELRSYANAVGVRIIGDIPIFVSHDSSDVWAHRELFELTEEGLPEFVSGVPPDYFSETGQRWGNPLYRWDDLARTGYEWWTERFRRTLDWVDVIRIDHFRGFEASWEIPASEPTAIHGRWVEGPGDAVFHAAERTLGPLPVIAEDLGLITPEVEELRDSLGYPGMRVLQFAFDGDPDNPHLPENYPHNVVAYTGTHDNNTSAGWWSEATAAEREQLSARIGDAADDIAWEMIRLAMKSPAGWAIVPLQDILGLDGSARMNVPGVTDGNWSWRFDEDMLSPGLAQRLRSLAAVCGR